MAPSAILQVAFDQAIKAFNDAHESGNYQNFQPHLHPTERIIIQKVDDPGDFVVGQSSDVIYYLNKDQVGIFPQFDYDKPPHTIERRTKHGDWVGNVTGKGEYRDKYTDKATIPVQYCLRFKKNDHGNWSLVTAIVAPI